MVNELSKLGTEFYHSIPQNTKFIDYCRLLTFASQLSTESHRTSRATKIQGLFRDHESQIATIFYPN